MSISFVHAPEIPGNADAVAVPVFADLRVPDGAGFDLEKSHLKALGFDGAVGQTAALAGDDGGVVVAVGVGPAAAVNAEVLRRAVAAFVRSAPGWRSRRPAVTLRAAAAGLDEATAVAAIVEGAALAAYQFGTYRSAPKPCAITRLSVVAEDRAATRSGIARGAALADATSFARDLVNEPSAVVNPTTFAERASAAAEAAGVTVEIWDEGRIAEERLGGILGVAQGSAQPPRLVRFQYTPPDAGDGPTLALVGKGITFDSGGLNLKTFEGMKTMKTDMSGAAAVAGAMTAIGRLGAPCRVVGWTPLAENMPSGTATRPGDVLRIRNGKTVEVLNTDAEGRLVLADALSLAVEEGSAAIVDIATLTGAAVQALGKDMAPLFANDDALAGAVLDAAGRAGEVLWRLPLHDRYRSHIESEVADIKNTGTPNEAGCLSAALFLREFVAGRPWAHLDIAGPSRADRDDAYLSRGGTAFGTRTLVELATSFTGGGEAPTDRA